MTEWKQTGATVRSTLERTADYWEIALANPSPILRERTRNQPVAAVAFGYREQGVPKTVRFINGGIAAEWEITFTPTGIVGAIRGRDKAGQALDTQFRQEFVVDSTTGLLTTLGCGTAPPSSTPTGPTVLGAATAKTVAQAAATAAELILDWQVRDYTLVKNFSARGTVLETIRQLVQPWDLPGPFAVDIFVRGSTLVVKHRTQPPAPLALPASSDYPQVPVVPFPATPVEWPFTMADAKRSGLSIRVRSLQRVGQVTFHGKSDGSLDGPGGQTRIEETEELTTKDQFEQPQQQTITTTHKLVPWNLALDSTRRVYWFVQTAVGRKRILVTEEFTTYNYGPETVLVPSLLKPNPLVAGLSGPGAGGAWASAASRGWRITALNATGETLASAEAVVTIGDTTRIVTLTWPTVAGATGYRLYRTDTPGIYGSASLLAQLGMATSYTDSGAATGGGSLPTANTVATIPVPATDRLTSQNVRRVQHGVLVDTTTGSSADVTVVTLFEDTGYVYDECGFCKEQSTMESYANAAVGKTATSRVVKHWRVIGPERVELRTTRYSAGLDGSFTPLSPSDTLIAGGYPPDGPGRHSGPGGTDGSDTIVQTATISSEPTAVPVEATFENLTLDDLNFIITLLAAGDSLWEWEANFVGVAMPWLQTGATIRFTDLRGEDLLPLELPPMIVTEMETRGEPTRLTQPTVRAFGWTKVA